MCLSRVPNLQFIDGLPGARLSVNSELNVNFCVYVQKSIQGVMGGREGVRAFIRFSKKSMI